MLQGLGKITKNIGIVSFLAGIGRGRLPNTRLEVTVIRADTVGVIVSVASHPKLSELLTTEHDLHMRTCTIEGLFICSIILKFHNVAHKDVTSLFHGGTLAEGDREKGAEEDTRYLGKRGTR